MKVVQSGQGADEVFAGYHWYPPMLEPGAAADGGVLAYSQAFFDRPDEAMAEVVAAAHRCPDDASGGVRVEPLRAGPAPPRPSTGPCASTPRSCSSTTR